MKDIFNAITEVIDYCEQDKDNDVYVSISIVLNAFAYDLKPIINHIEKIETLRNKPLKIYLISVLVSFGVISGYRKFMNSTKYNLLLSYKLDEIIDIYVNEYHDLIKDLI
jgi:hypothetical protein